MDTITQVATQSEALSPMAQALLFGAFGSSATEMLTLRSWLKKKKNRVPFEFWPFIFGLTLDIALGIVLIIAHMQILHELNPFLAIHIGASSTLLLKALAH